MGSKARQLVAADRCAVKRSAHGTEAEKRQERAENGSNLRGRGALPMGVSDLLAG